MKKNVENVEKWRIIKKMNKNLKNDGKWRKIKKNGKMKKTWRKMKNSGETMMKHVEKCRKMQWLWTGYELEIRATRQQDLCGLTLPWHKEASRWTHVGRSAMRVSQQDLPNKSCRVTSRSELRIETGFPPTSCTPSACLDSDQPISHWSSTGTTIVLEDAHRFHDGFRTDFMMTSTCPNPGASSHTYGIQLFWLKASHHLLTLDLDVIWFFLAISSSVRSNTSNAVALSIRDSPAQIATAYTPQGTLSVAFLSTHPFKFRRLSVPAANVFVPRSAQLSLRLHCLEPQRSHFQRFDLPDAFASPDPTRVKRCFHLITEEHQPIPCQQHLLGSRATSIELSHSRIKDCLPLKEYRGAPSTKSAPLDCDFRSVEPAQSLS